MKTIVALLFLLSCGAPPAMPVDPLVPGRYVADSYVAEGSLEGSCSWLKREFHTYVTIDDLGQVKSPLEGVIKCVTAYKWEGRIEIECDGLGATLGAWGVTWAENTKAEGSGVVRGDVAGCKSLTFGWLFTYAP